MAKIPVSSLLAGIVLWVAAFQAGCTADNAYRYDTIKTEYADLACNLGPSQAADTSGTCAVNSS